MTIGIDSSLGIEIRGDDVVCTVVKRTLSGFAAGKSHVIENFLQLDKTQLRQKLQQIRKQSGFNRENIILGLPRGEVILRQLELPLEASENLGQLLKYQVEYYQPSEDGASYFDYVVLRQDVERKRLVLLMGLVRKGWLDPYVDRLWTNRLPPSRVEISTSAVFNLITLKKELLASKNLVVVFDVNEHTSEIVVLRGREEVFSRELHIDVANLTVDHLLDQLQYLLSQVKIEDGAIDRFYFSGTHAETLLPPFKDRFPETELLANALKGKLKLRGDTRLSKSVGFALAPFRKKKQSPVSLNLIPPERRRVVRKIIYLPTALLALLLIGGLFASVGREYFQSQEFADELDARIKMLEPQVKELERIRADIDKTKADITYLQELTRDRATLLDVFKELTEKIPQEAYLQMLTVDTGAKYVDITGYSSNPTAIQNLLLKSAHLQKVENKYNTFDARVKKDRFNFRAEIRQ
ncbi:MAG TPA: pilus assembly protein PilM [Acidobacteriota bacterium]|jgi:Tfp pilus assembly protein PilN|nr:pilus assembly protein PilM [Acidobacteriota bacterium]